jgi:hypothetical protein
MSFIGLFNFLWMRFSIFFFNYILAYFTRWIISALIGIPSIKFTNWFFNLTLTTNFSFYYNSSNATA